MPSHSADPITTTKPPTPTPALALVVIARDEAASIAACLQSAAAVVHRMIVLETGDPVRPGSTR